MTLGYDPDCGYHSLITWQSLANKTVIARLNLARCKDGSLAYRYNPMHHLGEDLNWKNKLDEGIYPTALTGWVQKLDRHWKMRLVRVTIDVQVKHKCVSGEDLRKLKAQLSMEEL